MHTYIYNGAVRDYGPEGEIICNKQMITKAESPEKALSNISYRIKKELKKAPSSKIYLNPKYLKEV